MGQDEVSEGDRGLQAVVVGLFRKAPQLKHGDRICLVTRKESGLDERAEQVAFFTWQVLTVTIMMVWLLSRFKILMADCLQGLIKGPLEKAIHCD